MVEQLPVLDHVRVDAVILYAIIVILSFIAGAAFYALVAFAVLRWSVRL